jgi:hypothetical protein
VINNMEYNGQQIITSFDYPPIPIRTCDWSAVTDNYDGAEDSNDPIGRGTTEKEAIEDLIKQLGDMP